MEKQKVDGIIKSISEKVTTEHGTRLEYIVENTEKNDNGEWVTPVKIEMFCKTDKVEHLEAFLEHNKVGDSVSVEYQIRGRYWTNPKDGVEKCFNSFNHWRCEKTEDTAPVVEEVASDLPF